MTSKNWKFMQCFGDKNESSKVNECDIISALEFNQTGQYLAAGDRSGRVVIFVRGPTGLDYRFLTEIQSHESEFDYLKSIFIEEKICKVKWLPQQNNAQYLLSTNEKTIKLWKVCEKPSKVVVDNNCSSRPPIPCLPTVRDTDEVVVQSSLKASYANDHSYNINSLSACADAETFLSADDLRINIWNVSHPEASFNVLDIKPTHFECISEVITTAEFHPSDWHSFLWGSSKGIINLADMRQRALVHSPAVQFLQSKGHSQNIISEMVQGITCAKFSQDGRFVVSRDYMSICIWDINMPSAPIRRLPVNEYLMPKIGDLFDSELIYDKFDFCMNPTASQLMTGSYGNNFFIYDTINNSMQPFEANRQALKRSQSKGHLNSPIVGLESGGGGAGAKKPTGFPSLNQFNTDRKVMHVAWHPCENTVAVAATNMLYIFNQQYP